MGIKVDVTELKDLIVPHGTVVAGTRFTLTTPDGNSVVKEVKVGEVEEVVFDVTAAGSYSVSAQAFTADGGMLDSAVSTSVVIPEPVPATITVQVPNVITATVV